MDAIDYLLQEHDSHRKLLIQIETDKGMYLPFRSELVHHVNMEETILYPNLMKIQELEEVVRTAWEEHSLLMGLLQEMDQPDISEKLWSSKLSTLKKILLTHLDEEERDLFPKVRKLASPAFLFEVGEQMRIQKKLVSTADILYPDEPGSHKLKE